MICVEVKLADHPYFTRSKAIIPSFPDHSLDKGKRKMTGTSEETGIVDVTIRNDELTYQSELISQLMNRITDM